MANVCEKKIIFCFIELHNNLFASHQLWNESNFRIFDKKKTKTRLNLEKCYKLHVRFTHNDYIYIEYKIQFNFMFVIKQNWHYKIPYLFAKRCKRFFELLSFRFKVFLSVFCCNKVYYLTNLAKVFVCQAIFCYTHTCLYTYMSCHIHSY